MIESLISLASIFIGIVGSNLFGFFYKKYSMSVTANTIAGVFGSIFFIKAFGRLGLSPKIIMQTGSVNYGLLSLNFIVALLGGALALFIGFKLKKAFNK